MKVINGTDDLNLSDPSAVAKVFKNTYMLLSATLVFSAITAWCSMAFKLPVPGFLVMLIAFYGLLFLIHKTKDSGIGIALTFALTGLLGLCLGPMLNSVLGLSNGSTIVTQALLMTAATFVGLSLYVAKTGKDMSFLSGFITAGFFILIAAMVAAIFVKTTVLSLVISAGFVLFSCMTILFQTSQIINGGERNYILATVTLYISIYNLFVSLLSLTSFFSKDD